MVNPSKPGSSTTGAATENANAGSAEQGASAQASGGGTGSSQQGTSVTVAGVPDTAQVRATAVKEVHVSMPKVPCTIDLNAVDLPKQLEDFNDAFRDALISCNLIRDDGTYAISTQRIMAMWRSNLTQEVKDAIKELKFEDEFERTDYEIVSEKLVQMRKLRGLARMNDFNLSLVIRTANEPLEMFKKRILAQASLCEWSTDAEKNRALINQLVRGINSDQLRMKLLQSELQSFEELITLAIQLETTEKGSQKIAEAMAGASSSSNAHGAHALEDVHALRSRGGRGRSFGRSNFRGHPRSDPQSDTVICKHCGIRHAKTRQECTARDHVCTECGRQGHLEGFCYRCGQPGPRFPHNKRRGGYGSSGSPPKRGRTHEYGYAVHESAAGYDYDQEETLRASSTGEAPGGNVSTPFELVSEIFVPRDDSQREWFEKVSFCTGDLTMKIDSGATVDVMPMACFKQLKLSLSLVTKTNSRIVTYSQTVIKPLGEFRTRVAIRGRSTEARFMLIEGDGQPLLGLATSAALNLFSKDSLDRADELLSMHEEPVRIRLKPGAVPVQIPPRRVPIALRAKVKKELDRMVQIGVIRPVNEPTEWVHPMIVTDKPRNPDAIRVCIDPRHLNPFIERATFQIPNFETIMAEMTGVKVMSTIDLESGFWQAPVTPDSVHLLTFGTPWGRYQYLRLPFGLSNAPEEFHRRLVDALKDIPGVIVYLDDIFVGGENTQQHDERLATVWGRLKKVGFTPNMNKCKIRARSVRFLGHVIEDGKILPDPDKVKAILEFPSPKNETELRSFKGLVTFCAKFYPDLHHVLFPFRDLSKASATFAWTTKHEEAFQEVKNMVAEKVSLTLFDQGKPVEIWCDASPHGLGAVLLQDKGPVCCASRTLVGPEKNYPQIDMELLAVVWALERFNLFSYGRRVTLKTDHSPLTRIVKKPLAELSIRQQRLVARSLRYDFELLYQPGKFMSAPDAFSRAPIPAKREDIEFRSPLTPDIDVREAFILMLVDLPFSERLISLLRSGATADSSYAAAVSGYHQSWPSSQREAIGQYWSSRHDFHVDDGLLFFGQKVVVPMDARPAFLEALHRGHVGVSTMLRRAQSLWWPGMAGDCKDTVQGCVTCQINAPRQTREPMIFHEIPSAPGVVVSSDYAEFRGKSFVIIVDQFLGMAEHFAVADKTPRELIRCFLQFIARNGVPRLVVYDAQGSFISREFQQFCDRMNIKQVYCTPEHHQSNGLAESGVKRFKKWLASAKTDQELSLFMLQWAQTQLAPGRPSPAQIHFGRNLRDELHDRVEQAPVSWSDLKQWKEASREAVAQSYNRGTRQLTPLVVGDEVFVLIRDSWRTGVITKALDQPRAYAIRLHDTGRIIERNRKFLRVNMTGSKVATRPNFDQSLFVPVQDTDNRNIPRWNTWALITGISRIN